MPSRTYVDASVELEPDVRLLPGTILEGRTVIGTGSIIGPDCRLTDVVVGDEAFQLGQDGQPCHSDTRSMQQPDFDRSTTISVFAEYCERVSSLVAASPARRVYRES